MALATKCPHCNTTFRVAHDQLKLRGGIVRCGSCNEVFDGNAALIEPLAKPLPAPLPVAELSPAPLPEPTPFDEKMAALDTRAAEVLGGDAAEPIYTLELDTVMGAADVGAGTADADADADAEAEAEVDVDATPHDDSAAATVAAEPAPEHKPEPQPELGPDAEPALDAVSDFDDEPIVAPAPFTLPAEPATLSSAADDALDLDLDIEPEPETAAVEEELPLEDALSIESLSDAELEAALEAELAVMEHSITAPAGEPELVAEDANGRREPTLDEPPADAAPSSVADATTHTAAETVQQDSEYDDPDEEALVQLSSAGMASAQSARALAHLHTASARDEDETAATDDDVEGTADDNDEDDNEDEPGFVKRDRRRQKFGKAATIGMSVGSVLLVGALVFQCLTTFRNQIAAALPPLKPALLAACGALGCKIELPAQIDDLTIEQGELQTLTETTFSFTTLLRNQSSTAQTWPHIELVLDDAADKHILRRVFTPRDYLGPDVALDKGFAPHTEQSVKLYFELSQLKASGYHIAVFYP
jgi:predicted Zn finger-like uncharacterized protein